MPNYWQVVTEHSNRQYVTGTAQMPGKFVPDDVYSQALDALVVSCADGAVVKRKHASRPLSPTNCLWLIAKRAWEPQPDWWVIGGRMRKGELIEESLQRNLRRELFENKREYDIPLARLQGVIGYYNLIWDKRAQEPMTNGCHMLSVTSLVEVNTTELERLHLNEEYVDSRWVNPFNIIEDANEYHACLVQMAKDILAHF